MWQLSLLFQYHFADFLDYLHFLDSFQFIGFKAVRAMVMNSSIFWDVTPYGLLKVNKRFGGTRRMLALLAVSFWFLLGLFIYPKDGSDIFLRNIG
jgi:hypothetical protein